MRVDDDVSGWLRAAIRETAGRYEPDRSRMQARMRAAMAEQVRAGAPGPGRAATPERGRRARPRVAGVSLATAVAVAAIMTAGWQLYVSRTPGAPAERLAGGSSPTSSAPRRAAAPSDAAGPMVTTETPVPSPREASSVVSGGSGAGSFLTCTGTRAPDGTGLVTREKVTVSTERRLGALRVTFRVATTKSGVASPSTFLSLPPDDFWITVRERSGVLSYQFVLKAGRTVPRGDWTFTIQYHHANGGGHDDDRDTYGVSATATGDEDDVRLHGRF